MTHRERPSKRQHTADSDQSSSQSNQEGNPMHKAQSQEDQINERRSQQDQEESEDDTTRQLSHTKSQLDKEKYILYLIPNFKGRPEEDIHVWIS